MSEPGGSPLARFFGVVARPQSWRNLLYLALAFPLGLFYFVFLVVGLSVGISLAIIWVGIFILGLTAACSWAFAAFERSLSDGLLGTQLMPAPRPWKRVDGVWPRIKAHLGSGSTWKDLAFLFVKFPLGLLSFCVVTTLGAASLALATAPFYYRYASSTDAQGVVHHGLQLGSWYLNGFWYVLPLVPAGLLLGVVSFHVFNGLAAMWRAVARGLLPPGVAPQLAAAPAGPGAPPLATTVAQGSPAQPETPSPQWPGYPVYPPNVAQPAVPAGAGAAQAPGTDPAGQPAYGWPPYYSQAPQPYPQQPSYPQQPYPQQPSYPPQPYPQQPYAQQPSYPPQTGQPPTPQAGDTPAPPAGAPWPGTQWPGSPWPQWSPLFGPPQAAPGGQAAAPVAPPTGPPPVTPATPVTPAAPVAPIEPATPAEPPKPGATAPLGEPPDQAAPEPAAGDQAASQDNQTASQEEQS